MGLGKSVGQSVLYAIVFLLVVLGLTGSGGNNWMLIIIGFVVLLLGRYFKKQLETMGC